MSYLDQITPLAKRVAQEAFDAFEQRQRGDETITTLRDDRPQWVYDAVFSAHGNGEFLPDDWRYDKTQDAFGAIADALEGSDPTEVGDEFADGAVDVYTHDRLAWLASNLNRPSYCDDAAAEFGADTASDIIGMIGMGQYAEAREIFSAVLSAVADRCDEIGD